MAPLSARFLAWKYGTFKKMFETMLILTITILKFDNVTVREKTKTRKINTNTNYE
jgi:hypothetical protein